MTDSSQQLLTARLAALRMQGADHNAPVRFAYLEDLLLRARTRGGPVAERLLVRVAQGLEQFESGLGKRGAKEERVPVSQVLRGLQNQLQGEAPGEAATPPSNPILSGAPMTLKSVDVLRDTWVKLKQSQRVTEAICQPPENAGPLNSHHLVIRSLETLRNLSPAYLAHFMEYVDTVLLLQPAPVQESARARKSAEARGKARKR